ncbi:uncharacterized protein LOC144320325 [Canis aureus]
MDQGSGARTLHRVDISSCPGKDMGLCDQRDWTSVVASPPVTEPLNCRAPGSSIAIVAYVSMPGAHLHLCNRVQQEDALGDTETQDTWDISLSSPDFSTKRYSGPVHLDVPHD